MSIWQSFIVGLNMLRLNKLRSFLTMLGVIIGVFSVSLIVMISSGFQSYLTKSFNQLGADTIFVFFDPGRRARGATTGSIEGLTVDDVQYLRDRVPVLDVISPIMQIPSQKVTVGEKEVNNPRIFASDENFSELNRVKAIEGRHLTQADVASRANVAVIGEELRDRLFPDKQALGRFITMQGITLEVVGVFERLDIAGESNARDVLLPLTTAQDKWIGGRTIMFMSMRPKPGVKVDDAMNRIWEAMMAKSNNRRIYRVDSRESILKVFGGVIGAAGVILAAVAALSLLVGGIGIMNIMLVSVTERTREIGLRKSVGAKNGTILTQFLVEAATLSLIGGAIGMLMAFGLGTLVTLITATRNWPTEGGLQAPFPLAAAVAAMGFSAFIGVVFGLYPAMRASRLSPIEALRTE